VSEVDYRQAQSGAMCVSLALSPLAHSANAVAVTTDVYALRRSRLSSLYFSVRLFF
jgi:hypothetical protein